MHAEKMETTTATIAVVFQVNDGWAYAHESVSTFHSQYDLEASNGDLRFKHEAISKCAAQVPSSLGLYIITHNQDVQQNAD